MLSVKIRKKIFYDRLNELLKPEGYKLINTGEDPCYLKKNKNNVTWLGLHFLRAGSITCGLYSSINEIEDLMIEIGKPGRKNMDMYLERKKYFLATLRDVRFENSIKERYHLYSFKNEEEFAQFSQWVSKYIENQGFDFLQHYSFLPNILAKMNILDKENIPWHKRGLGILSGTLDGYFRGLIISKLCGDQDFNNKLLKMDEKFSQHIYKEWMPYYKKLKKKLETIEPKYDVSLGKVLESDEII